MAASDLARKLASLEQMDGPALRTYWSERSDRAIPQVSPKLLRLALAWELQAAVHGGLPRRVSQRLDQLAGGRTRTQQASPGTRLVREWNGTLHVVTIEEGGAIHWNGKTWKSLSEIARVITGTRWSGPAFFGLRRKQAA